MARSSAGGSRPRARRKDPTTSDGVQGIYNEMLQEVLSSTPPTESVRPLKRRKAADGGAAATRFDDMGEPLASMEDQVKPITSMGSPRFGAGQTAYTDSDDSAESDLDWEEVDLAQSTAQEDDSNDERRLDLVLDGNVRSEAAEDQSRKRKPATAAERKLRLVIHKMHVLCLLAHVHLRNHWCNDEQVHKHLRKLLSKKNVQYLNPDEKFSQFQRTRSFLDGLKMAEQAFKVQFEVTARGMSRSYWTDDVEKLADARIPEDLDLPIEKSDFQELAEKRSASRDVGAQLFCATLRSVGVDARLVCSLQPLPFSGASKGKPRTPEKSKIYVAVTPTDNAEVSKTNSDSTQTPKENNQAVAIGSLGGRNRFNPGPSLSENDLSTRSLAYVPKRPKRITESPFPIYWVEAFDEAAQKWICVDPLVTQTIGKPSKIEPPISDSANNMNYVIAFEDDGSARDVTRRYSKAYNAKTRRNRVESTQEGAKWLKKVMGLYRRSQSLDRDQIEDTEFARKEAQEGLPQNVQDFKDHPYYALERHLRRNEVIHPRRETGKVMTAKAASGKGSEPIYRRCDVHVVRSADKWYRMGREIRPGEQPLKRVAARRKPPNTPNEEEPAEGDEENVDTALYAHHQTIEYQPPPVVNDRVPRNVYNNLDIYVPSMIPAGGAHVKHPECARAARVLGIDYADAVTGFNFKGRHGTAIVNGAVIAAEYASAVREVIDGFAIERIQAEEARKTQEALRMWRRFIAGLRIRERIEGYSVEGEADAIQEATAEDESMSYEAGGFFPTGEVEDVAVPTAPGSLSQRTTDDTKAIRDIGSAAQRFDGSPSARPDFINDRLDERLDPNAHGSLHNNHYPTPDIEIVYGKSVDIRNTVASVEAGGFMNGPEIEEAQIGEKIEAGGFMTEDNAETHEAQLKRRIDDDFALSNLADDDLAQATMLQQQTFESRHLIPDGEDDKSMRDSSQQPDCLQVGDRASLDSMSPPSDTASGQAVLEKRPSPTIPGSDGQVQNPESDEGSLLSEDPDDEDADPEWLA